MTMIARVSKNRDFQTITFPDSIVPQGLHVVPHHRNKKWSTIYIIDNKHRMWIGDLRFVGAKKNEPKVKWKIVSHFPLKGTMLNETSGKN